MTVARTTAASESADRMRWIIPLWDTFAHAQAHPSHPDDRRVDRRHDLARRRPVARHGHRRRLRARRAVSSATTPPRWSSNGPVQANWLADDRFWYRNVTATGSEFILVDAARATKAPAFNHAAVAATLTTALGKPVTAARLPFTQITFAADAPVVLVRQRHQALDLRRAGRGVHQRRPARPALPTASPRPTASWPPSSATTTSGSATSRPAPTSS